MDILIRLRDIAINKDIYEVFKDDIGVQKSLLRESSAEKALFEAKYVLRNDKLEEKDISFQCSYKAPYSLNAIELNFNLRRTSIFHTEFVQLWEEMELERHSFCHN